MGLQWVRVRVRNEWVGQELGVGQQLTLQKLINKHNDAITTNPTIKTQQQQTQQ